MDQENKNQANGEIKNNSNNKKIDLENSLSLFGRDKEDFNVDEEILYEVTIPKDTTDKILKISRMVQVAVLTISGYEELPSGESNTSVYKLTKDPMAGTEVIKGFEGLLKTYADESNIISKKDWDSYSIQVRSDWGAFYKLYLREKTSPEQKKRTVERIFQNCLINIGEITCDNPGNMNKLFGAINRDQREQEDKKVW